eukprot:14304284-Alexandrium_andersonii.AAC.1
MAAGPSEDRLWQDDGSGTCAAYLGGATAGGEAQAGDLDLCSCKAVLTSVGQLFEQVPDPCQRKLPSPE